MTEPAANGGVTPDDPDLGSFTGSRLVDTAIRLYADYADVLALAQIMAVVDHCRNDLEGSPDKDLPELIERLARVRLDQLSDRGEA